jgi:hypothetical protein
VDAPGVKVIERALSFLGTLRHIRVTQLFSRENCVGVSHHSMFVAVFALRSRISREVEKNLTMPAACIVLVSLNFSDPFHLCTLSKCSVSMIVCPKILTELTRGKLVA